MSKKNKVNDGKKKVNKRNNIFKKIFCVNGKYGIQNRVPYFLFYTFTK